MAEMPTLRRFLELERRVYRIERKLQMGDSFDESVELVEIPEPPRGLQEDMGIGLPSAEVVVEPAVAVLTAEAPAVAPATQAPEPPPAEPPPLPSIFQELNARKAAARHAVPPVVQYASPVQKAPRTDQGGALETWIGLNWTGWIGAIVLVIGAALGIKYGYDQGWFGGLPAGVRLGFCFCFGVALLGVGEWVDRRVNRISAAGVFAAGIATLFVVSYAGFGYFELYDQPTAFVLMAIATLVGSAIALRKNLVVIATLSLLGGNIAPIVLHSDHPKIAALLGYILVLQLVSLVLANVGKGGKWWILRGFAIAMPALWTLVAYSTAADPTLPLVFSIVYAVLVQGELIFAANRVETHQRGLIAPASILVTVLLTLSLLYGLRTCPQWQQGLAMLGLAAACYTPGLMLRGSRRELSLAYRVQAAMLLLIAVPVGLSGASIIWAWAGLSLAYVIVGRALKSEIGWQFGVAAWVFAGLYLVRWTNTNELAHQIAWLNLPHYAVTAIGLTVIGHVLSQLLVGQKRTIVTAVDLLASGMFLVATIAALDSWYATGAILLYAWAMFIAGRGLGREEWELQGGGLLLVSLVKWGSIDMLGARLAPAPAAGKYLPVLNPIMGVGTAVAGSVIGMYAMTRQLLEERLQTYASNLAIAVASLIIAILTFGLSVEVSEVARLAGGFPWSVWQLRGMGWTVLWTAAVAIHAGLIYKLVPQVDRRSWFGFTTVAMSLIAMKFLAIDVLLGCLGSSSGVTPIANLQTLTCCVVVAGLGLIWWIRDAEGRSWPFGGGLLLAILLVVGTVEIDRSFEHFGARGLFADAGLAKQVAISIYWAVFGVTAIVAGFRIRLAGLRYFGLALLAIALVKVVGWDLQELGRGYRILSFIGLGGLLLATSVVYGKLSPILLKQEATAV